MDTCTAGAQVLGRPRPEIHNKVGIQVVSYVGNLVN